MFERMTGKAKLAMVLAEQEARTRGHDHIGTEHLLVGMISPDSPNATSVAVQVLEFQGVSPTDVLRRVEELVPSVESPPELRHLPFDGGAKKVLELSLREALQLGHNFIGTEHMLNGLVREGGGVAAQVLTEAGVTLESNREMIHKAHGTNAGTL